MSVFSAMAIVESVVGVVSRKIATKLGQRVLASAWFKGKILAGLMKEPDDWISLEYAVMMVSSMDFADERMNELVQEFHMDYQEWRAPANEARKYVAKVEQEVPRAILQTFVAKHPWAYRNGRYQRSVLLLWLRN